MVEKYKYRFKGDQSPILILGIAGGGTGKLWDLIISHPRCQTPGPELNEIFMYGPKRKVFKNINHKIERWLNPSFSGFWSLFDYRILNKVEETPVITTKQVRFFERKISTLIHKRSLLSEDRFKCEGVPYEKHEIENLRPVFKALEGAIASAYFLKAVYPDLKIICLIRNGLAYTESKLRHERADGVKSCAQVYNYTYEIFKSLIENYGAYPLRYEDYVVNPLEETRKVYNYLDLDFEDLENFKIQGRGFIGSSKDYGKKNIMTPKKWYRKEELSNHFKSDINTKAIARLGEDQIDAFMKECQESMDYFNYSKE